MYLCIWDKVHISYNITYIKLLNFFNYDESPSYHTFKCNKIVYIIFTLYIISGVDSFATITWIDLKAGSTFSLAKKLTASVVDRRCATFNVYMYTWKNIGNKG
jgi:hypothetical protein